MKKHLFMFLPLAAIAFIAFSCDEPSKNTEEDSWTDDSPIITFKDPYFVDAIFDRDRIWEHEGIPSSIFGAFGKDEIPVDRNNDGQISEKEAMQVELLNISGGNKSTRAIGLTRAAKDVVYTGYRIRGIDEIKYFTNLTQLMCGGNDLTSIDVSNNLSLRVLDCSFIHINMNLLQSDIYDEQLVTGFQLSSLDVSKNKALASLYCSGNLLTGLDVSRNTALIDLSCDDNLLTNLDISNNITLVNLDCSGNQLSELNLNTALETIICTGNKLTKLDSSKSTALISLDCAYNQLIELKLSAASQSVVCANNKLTKLDLSRSTELSNLDCSSNQLTELDLSKNTALYSLNCAGNQLTELDLRKNTKLQQLIIGWSLKTLYLYKYHTIDSKVIDTIVRNNPNLTIFYVE